MNISSVIASQNYKKQNFSALPKGRPPELKELVQEVGEVLASRSKEAARQLLTDYQTLAPRASHEITLLNIAYFLHGRSVLPKTYDLFGISLQKKSLAPRHS